MEEVNKKLEILLSRTRNLEKLEQAVNQINCNLIDLEKKVHDDYKNISIKSKTASLS